MGKSRKWGGLNAIPIGVDVELVTAYASCAVKWDADAPGSKLGAFRTAGLTTGMIAIVVGGVTNELTNLTWITLVTIVSNALTVRLFVIGFTRVNNTIAAPGAGVIANPVGFAMGKQNRARLLVKMLFRIADPL